MSNEKETASDNSAINSEVFLPIQENECPAFVKKIGKTTYHVRIDFSTTSWETMSDKIKRMLRNEVSRI